jgi:manganese/zinc/iron transport system permease protein
MAISLLELFTDPIFRAPFIGSMLICLAMALVGVILFVRHRLLSGEALSHAIYPGVVISAMVASALYAFPGEDEGLSVIMGAFISSLIGLFCLDFLEKKVRLYGDAALCFILSVFFGVGVLFASRIQYTHAIWYKQVQVFLYGQAATLDDRHLVPLALLSSLCVCLVVVLYRYIQWMTFDRDHIKGMGGRVRLVDGLINFLLILSLVVGMRCVGVVLMSGMLVAPAVAARFWCGRLSRFFLLAGLFGIASGGLGNILCLKIPLWSGIAHLSLPTGPLIVLTAVFFALVSMFFAPQKGLCVRFLRFLSFRHQIALENLLKALWKKGVEHSWSAKTLRSFIPLSKVGKYLIFWDLLRQGWVVKKSKGFFGLSSDGQRKAAHIVRLHRLWEVYLVECLGQHKEKAHHNAEEMEHVLTPELEKQLTQILNNPKRDPHKQPIPEES